MKKTKEWFISQYNEIHGNLSFLEKELEYRSRNKEDIINNKLILEDLKRRVVKEVKRLEKTRKDERKIFNC